jgi:hypothetical protein
MRCLGLAPRRAAGAALLAAGAAVVGDATLLGGLALTLAAGAAWSWWAVAAAGVSVVRLSVVRLSAAAMAAHRCARFRAAAA